MVYAVYTQCIYNEYILYSVVTSAPDEEILNTKN